MKLFKIILLFLVLSGAALFAFAYFLGVFDNSQSKACGKLKPGITKADLIAALGAPTGRPRPSAKERGDIWILSFRTNIVAAGPIEAGVGRKTEKVVWLRCSYDGPYAWKIDQ